VLSNPHVSRALERFRPRPLIGFTDDEVRRYVRGFVRTFFPVSRGEPHFVFYRRTTVEDPDLARLAPRTALKSIFAPADPLIVVSLQGDFVTGYFNFPGPGKLVPAAQLATPGVQRVGYAGLLFIFDMHGRDPRLTALSHDGSGLLPPFVG
jgi:hypothetical protein